MFGTINRFLSRLDSESPSQYPRDTPNQYGFQVLRNTNYDLPVEPWYDFITGINGRPVDNPSPALFAAEIRNSAGSTVSLTLSSAKGQRNRTLTIPVPETPTLGLTLQFSPLSISEQTWHILSVAPSSPADIAGLLPYGDYIVGTPEGTIHGEAGLGELVEEHLSREMRLYVYNHEYNVTRQISITPSRSWGGEGALGCVLGFGALHRLPVPLNEPPAAPGETLFETARFSNEENRPLNSRPSQTSLYTSPPLPSSENLLVPATMASPPPPPAAFGPTTKSGQKIEGKQRKGRKQISPNRAFEEYFREGEERSREEDLVPGTKGKTPPPPPPPTAADAGKREGQEQREGQKEGEREAES